MRIDIESAADDARAARRQVLTLIAAYDGGETTYMAVLEDLVNAVMQGTADPAELASRIAYFIDAASLIGFALAKSVAELEQEDTAAVLKSVEDAIEKRLGGSTPAS